MSFSTLPLSYCTNVHPGLTVSEVIDGLQKYTQQIQQQFEHPLAAGLWLSNPVIQEITSNPGQLVAVRDCLRDTQLTTYTLNAFPYGDFHSERVKENVYLPDWTANSRLQYTTQCAQVLAFLLPEGVEGSLSTLPLGFKSLCRTTAFRSECISRLIEFAREMDRLHDESGQVIRLAIEPEPLCILETTAETILFFDELRSCAKSQNELDIVQRHIGVCFDVCHQSVEFEDVAESIHQLVDAEIRLNKVHITCAIESNSPTSASLAELSQFIEPRYLHQTFAKSSTGQLMHITDLDQAFCQSPPRDFRDAETWRVHFHVPVNTESLGLLSTTRGDLKRALQQVLLLNYAPHLEVETYTWNVLPGRGKPTLVDGITQELLATRELLDQIAATEKQHTVRSNR